MSKEVFYSKLKNVENDVVEMGEVCIESIKKSVDAFLNKDMDLAEQVVKEDDIIDLKEMEIEEKCVKLIALYQPVATDLRTILTIIKIISKLEKIGDCSSKIASIPLKSKLNIKRENEIINVMVERLDKMLNDAMLSFKNRDEKLARDVYSQDKKIDKLYEQLYREMISYIIEDPRDITMATETIFMAKYLERTGDIIASIGDRVVYMVTGERIKEEEFEKKYNVKKIKYIKIDK
ncbi:phosphate signaling complex protein PhoU [Methanothermococcus sp. SCGC AD-155-C09]|nr:phosphate signaling complex protein PhoU [Methanothermococcus sp. SCGC AD-155-C09]